MPHTIDDAGIGAADSENRTGGWHPAAIRAAVRMRGKTLKQLALAYDLHPAACQRAVIARNTPGERAIADFLGAALWDIWPDRWRRPEGNDGAAIRIDHRRRPTDVPRAEGGVNPASVIQGEDTP